MSTRIQLTDKGGNSYYVHRVDGEDFPPFPVEEDYGLHLSNLKQLKLRDDDVLIIGAAKSGTHWMFEVTSMLLAGNTEYRKEIKENQFFETKKMTELDQLPSPRILNTHFKFRYLPSDLLVTKPKIIYLLRNPKDVSVSMFHHLTGMKGGTEYNADWPTFFEKFLHGTSSWFNVVLGYERAFTEHPHLPVCTIVYEDMKQDPVSNIQRLAEFLGKRASSEFYHQVADACSFQKLKKANDEIKKDPMKKPWKAGTGMYRKGQVGDWKNWYTVAQSEIFDAMYRDRMKDSKLTFRYE